MKMNISKIVFIFENLILSAFISSLLFSGCNNINSNNPDDNFKLDTAVINIIIKPLQVCKTSCLDPTQRPFFWSHSKYQIFYTDYDFMNHKSFIYCYTLWEHNDKMLYNRANCNFLSNLILSSDDNYLYFIQPFDDNNSQYGHFGYISKLDINAKTVEDVVIDSVENFILSPDGKYLAYYTNPSPTFNAILFNMSSDSSILLGHLSLMYPEVLAFTSDSENLIYQDSSGFFKYDIIQGTKTQISYPEAEQYQNPKQPPNIKIDNYYTNYYYYWWKITVDDSVSSFNRNFKSSGSYLYATGDVGWSLDRQFNIVGYAITYYPYTYEYSFLIDMKNRDIVQVDLQGFWLDFGVYEHIGASSCAFSSDCKYFAYMSYINYNNYLYILILKK